MRRIGLLSDSHGNAKATRAGARILAERRADVLLHLGDIGTIEVIDAMLVEHPDTGNVIQCRVVFGNTDWDQSSLRRHADRHGITIDHPVGCLPVNGGKLVYTHGDQTRINNQALSEGVTYFCHGHTHKLADTRVGQTRVINPGALHRAHRYTVALLNVAEDQVEFHDVNK